MAKSLSPTLIIFSLLLVAGVSSTSIDTYVYGGCSQLRYTPGSPYESTLNSLLTSLVNSASFSLYNNFTSSSQYPSPTIYGLYQCRGDLPPTDCSRCIARAVTQLGTLCASSCGGALQLDGCLIKYDNVTFLGVEDKTVLFRKCGPYDDDSTSTLSARRNAVLDYVAAAGGGGGGGGYRVGGSGEIHAVAQCVQDLSRSECQDCVSEAVGELKSTCGASAWGDMFLGKCYARFSEGGGHSRGGGGGGDGKSSNNSDEEIEKTLAILIGLIAGVALLIVFLSFLRKLCEKGKGGK